MNIHPRFSLALLAAACAVALPAAGQGLRPAGSMVQSGIGDGRTWNAGAGVYWPWAWKRGLLGLEVGGVTEAYISHWDAPATSSGGRRGFTQLAVVPLVRFRFDQGRSLWFAEAGIGASVTDQLFSTPEKQFSTSFNFVDVVGLGRSFGAARDQELSVRVQHVSNASIRSPNPGQNFVQLRYASRF